MRILAFNWRDITHPKAGGAEQFIHEISKRLVAKGHSVTLYCGDYKGSENAPKIIDGVSIIRRGNEFTLYINAVTDYLGKFFGKYDLIIDCNNGIPFFSPLFSGVPKILVVHHFMKEIFFKEVSFPHASLAYILERAIPFAYMGTKVIAVSENTRDEAISMGINPKNIRIVYNGVSSRLCPAFENKAKYPLVVSVGRLKKYKRLNMLVEAFGKALEQLDEDMASKAKLVIAGKGDAEDDIRNTIKRLGLESKVIMKGFISEEEKFKLLQEAWVFAAPSSKEGWGIAVIESSACGTPVVAFDVPGLRNSVRDGETGILVREETSEALGKALVRLLVNKEEREKMSRSAVAWGKRFDWDSCAQDFMNVIDEVVGRKVPEKPVKVPVSADRAVINAKPAVVYCLAHKAYDLDEEHGNVYKKETKADLR
ncbi:MAG: glycosyltransferase family 4 protein [Thermoplasmata archaeon]